jgi:hypothetical protein
LDLTRWFRRHRHAARWKRRRRTGPFEPLFALGPSGPPPAYAAPEFAYSGKAKKGKGPRQPPAPVAAQPDSAASELSTTDKAKLLAVAVCLLKLKGEEACQEKFGALSCSAASQWLEKGKVDAAEVAEGVAISEATKDNALAQFLATAVELKTCYDEYEPRIEAAARAR